MDIHGDFDFTQLDTNLILVHLLRKYHKRHCANEGAILTVFFFQRNDASATILLYVAWQVHERVDEVSVLGLNSSMSSLALNLNNITGCQQQQQQKCVHRKDCRSVLTSRQTFHMMVS